jgi:hypothetical protein
MLSGGESAGRPRAGRFGAPVRGTSGLHRARCWVTPSRGDPQESATENRPPMAGPVAGRGPAQVRVKRCGKSAPAPGATRAARQTPPGARPRRGRTARPRTPPGRPLEPAGNRRPRGMAAAAVPRDRRTESGVPADSPPVLTRENAGKSGLRSVALPHRIGQRVHLLRLERCHVTPLTLRQLDDQRSAPVTASSCCRTTVSIRPAACARS